MKDGTDSMSNSVKVWLLILAVLAALVLAGRWENAHRDPHAPPYSEGPNDYP